MNRRQWMMSSAVALAVRRVTGQTQQPPAQDSPENFRLKDYHPRSIYRVPKTDIKRAKYPIVDVHCHGARPVAKLDEMVQVMDAVGVEKTVIFTGANSADRLTEARQTYSKYPNRFDMWCSFDLTGPDPVKSLEDCHRAGAVGVGEISDKGFGFILASDGNEYFFHNSACADTRFDDLREGQAVTFEKGQGPKGPRGENVRVA